MMMYVGNKKCSGDERTDNYAGVQAIELQLDKEGEPGAVMERGKADRMIRTRTSNFYPEVPVGETRSSSCNRQSELSEGLEVVREAGKSLC